MASCIIAGVKQKLLTADAARILNVTPATVRQMHARGKLPAERTARGTRLFDRTAVEKLRAARAAQRNDGDEAA